MDTFLNGPELQEWIMEILAAYKTGRGIPSTLEQGIYYSITLLHLGVAKKNKKTCILGGSWLPPTPMYFFLVLFGHTSMHNVDVSNSQVNHLISLFMVS